MFSIINPILSQAFAAVLRLSWQASLLIVAVLLVQWLARRGLPTRWRYNLWLIVVIRLLLPFSPESSLSVFNVIRLGAARHSTTLDRSAEVASVKATASLAPAGIPPVPDQPRPARANRTGDNRQDALSAAVMRPSASVAAVTPRPPFPWLAAAAWAWLAGAAGFSACIVWTAMRAMRQVRRVAPVDDPSIVALFEACRRQMNVRARVSLRETAFVKSPALFGVFRPRLLLPPGLTQRFSPAELRYVFLHELAHVKRRDVAMNWALTLLQALHWFNPAIWFGFARMRADRELACDALAISCAGEQEAKTYGLTIIKLLESFSRPAASPGLVGIMENKSQMARRIRLIAGFRRHGRWSWLAAALMAALAVTGLTDAVRSTRAESPKAPAAKPLRLTVLDAQTGEPIPNASVIAGYNRGISFSAPPPLIRTDASGVAVVPGERFLIAMGVGVFDSDHAPQGIEWFWHSGNARPENPTEYTLKLERGETIGGTLRDEAGQPLANVRVEIKGICDPRKSGEKLPTVQEYPFYDPAFNPCAVTDAEGRWSCAHFSPAMEVLQLDFRRADGSLARFHTALERWKYTPPGGELIDMAAARRGDLVCVFKKGTDVRGAALDAAGHPLAGVKVTETDRRNRPRPVSVSETGADGRFILPNRDPHQILLTLTGPGLAIKAEVVSVAPGMPELALTMHPATPLRVRMVDGKGRPIAGARLSPSELDMGWSGATDADGRVAWEQAPAEPIAYHVGAEGYGPRVVRLAAASGVEQTVTLRKGEPPGTLLTIKAADETGHPLDAFTVAAAYWQNGGSMDDFDASEAIGAGRDGVCIALLPFGKGRFRLKIESPGLEPYVSDPLDQRPEDTELAVILRKSGSSRLTLRLPDGQPAAGARVAVKDTTSGDSTFIQLGFLSSDGQPSIDGQHLKTARGDELGRVTLPGGAADALAVVIHEKGYLLTTLERLRQGAEARLNAWGRLEGTLTINDHPKADQRLELQHDGQTIPAGVWLTYFVTSGADGRFAFEQVPAGQFTLYCTQPSKGTWPQSHPVAVAVAAGQIARIAYGAEGRTLTGRLQTRPADADIDWKKDAVNCMFTLRQPAPPRDQRGDAPAYEDFIRQEDYLQAHNRYLAAHRFAPAQERDTYQAEIAADGSLRVEGIPPGTYDLNVELIRSTLVDQQWKNDRLGSLQREVVVPAAASAESADAPVDLGALEVAVNHIGTAPKSPPVAFIARALDNGQFVNLADYRGKTVLLVFWASWAAIPAEPLAQWKSVADTHGADPRFVMLGVSLDDDANAARQFALAHTLPGVQTQLEGGAKATVTETLAVDELPKALLLGPDGRLAVRDLTGPRLRVAVDAAISSTK
jgi:beta-lactamase regulating signal transducer with metallopeptidase domain